MRYRTFGRTGWQVTEIGYGMWGMAGWTGSADQTSRRSLAAGSRSGLQLLRHGLGLRRRTQRTAPGGTPPRNPQKKLYTATKIPPKNRCWPSRPSYLLDDVFPPDYIREYTDKSLKNLGQPSIDLMQFHVWEDAWARDERWQRAMGDLKRQGLIRAVGISINRWEPRNALQTLRTGVIDSVQVIYNIFDQAPEDELFPLCRELNVGIIARVPFDEGTLTGTLTRETRWPEGDWRNSYFVPENLIPSVERADALKPLVPLGMTMPEMALRFILSNPDVDTIIPGMRKPANVRTNLAASDAGPLPATLHAQLRKHRWDRTPTAWSQ